jgi:hypothetical protein
MLLLSIDSRVELWGQSQYKIITMNMLKANMTMDLAFELDLKKDSKD